jgi:hypothetical protein
MATQESTISLKKQNDVPSNATVSVASKLPMDLTLKLFNFVTKNELVMGGGSREVKVAELARGAKHFVVQGNSWAQNKGAHQQIVGGYAITHGIPREFWERWLEQNKESDIVVNGMLFAHGESASTIAEAKEKEDQKSGLERLDPNKLPKGLHKSDMVRQAV